MRYKSVLNIGYIINLIENVITIESIFILSFSCPKDVVPFSFLCPIEYLLRTGDYVVAIKSYNPIYTMGQVFCNVITKGDLS